MTTPFPMFELFVGRDREGRAFFRVEWLAGDVRRQLYECGTAADRVLAAAEGRVRRATKEELEWGARPRGRYEVDE